MNIITLKNQKILLISDTHGKHRLLEIPDDIQIIVHCGDICNGGNMPEIEDFFLWFSALKIPHKIFINGNHDLIFDLEPELSKKLIPKNVIWLNDKTCQINGIRIQSVSPFFYYQNQQTEKNIDILISHYPPFGILDNGIGSRELRNYAFEIQPKFCIFGHNHENGNRQEELEQIQFINASVFNDLFVKK